MTRNSVTTTQEEQSDDREVETPPPESRIDHFPEYPDELPDEIPAYKDDLDAEGFEQPVYFQISYIGEKVILPFDTAENILTEFGLQEGDGYTVRFDGVKEDKRMWYGAAFDAAAVDDPKTLIEKLQSGIDVHNTPPDRFDGEKIREWAQSLVVLTDVDGVDYTPRLHQNAKNRPSNSGGS